MDRQHEAAIKLVARLMHGMDPGDCSYTLPRNWIDEARKIVAAYDAACSGPAAEGIKPTETQYNAIVRLQGELAAAQSERDEAWAAASEKTRFCSECAHTTCKHRGTKRGGTSCDVAGCRCPALPEDHLSQRHPSDIERNTYTADRALGLHTARLAEQDHPVDRASPGGTSAFGDLHVGRSWDGHPLEDDCPCPKEPCGLVSLSRADPACEQHSGMKTIRQAHSLGDCPGSAGPLLKTEEAQERAWDAFAAAYNLRGHVAAHAAFSAGVAWANDDPRCRLQDGGEQ